MATFSDLNYLKPTAGAIIEDEADLYQALYTRFSTKKCTRLFRPSFGGNLSRYLFEPCDEYTARSMMYDIIEELKEEPRVELNTAKSSVTPDPENHCFYILLCFTRTGSNVERSITLTFEQ